MKAKLSPVFIIVGLFLFKVVLVDKVLHLENHSGAHRAIGSESAPSNNLKAIR